MATDGGEAAAPRGGEGLRRDPPEGVKETLRREVGFGCPIQGCREPFLSWHHFDPPWSQEHHHRPEGMIALCLKHHGMADRGVYTRQRLRDLKQASHSVETVKAAFEWLRPNHLVRLGGCYFGNRGGMTILRGGGDDVIRLDPGPEELLELSFVLRAQDGRVVASMRRNMFEAGAVPIHDLSVDSGGKGLKIRMQKRDILCSMTWSEVTREELLKLLAADCARSKAVTPSWAREMIADAGAHNTGMPPAPLEGLDTMSHEIIAWAEANCLGEEGRISLLDFRNLSLWLGGQQMVIRDGISTAGFTLSNVAMFDSPGGFSV